MARTAVQLLGVTMTGLLAGNEVGTLIGLHPALRTLPLAAQIQAEQALTARLGRIMPFCMGATVLATTTAAVDQRGEPGFPLAATAAAASALMLGVTLVGNVPLNAQTSAYLTDGDAGGLGAHPAALGAAARGARPARPRRRRCLGRCHGEHRPGLPMSAGRNPA